MNTTNSLFNLIKSLSGSEKRHFSIFASRHIIGKENSYLLLFKLLDKQKEYDEESILRSEKRIKKELIHNLKAYLQELILRSLEQFYSKGSVENEIYRLIHQVEILHQKGLHSMCKKKLLKAKILAYDYGKLKILPVLLQWQLQIIENGPDPDKIETEVASVLDEQKKIQEKIRLINELETLRIRMDYWRLQHQEVRNKKESDRIRKFILNYRHAKEKALPFYAAQSYLRALGIYYMAVKQFKSSQLFFKKNLALFDSNPKIRAEQPNLYMGCLNNLVIAYISDGNFSAAENTLALIKNLAVLIPQVSKSVKIQSRIFRSYYSPLLVIYLQKGDFEKAANQLSGILNGLNKYRPLLNEKFLTAFYYNISHVYFGNKDYKNSLKWITKIFNESSQDFQIELHRSSRIALLMILFEIGNDPLHSYFLKSTQNFIIKKGIYGRAEKLILGSFERIYKANSRKQLKLLFSELKKKLQELKKHPYEKDALTVFNLESWIDSKIED